VAHDNHEPGGDYLVDDRIARWAGVLVDYCLHLKRGDLFEIVAEPAAWPLVVATYERALRTGAHPVWRALSDELDAMFLAHADQHQLEYLSPLDAQAAAQIAARLTIRGGTNRAGVSAIPASRTATRQRAVAPLRRLIRERVGREELKPCITLFPTPAEAQAAGMSTGDFAEYVYKACFLDLEDPVAAWLALRARQQVLVDMLDRIRVIRVEAAGTDITFGVGGRRWVNSSARRNFPSGEVFTGPIEGTANGVIRFSFPGRFEGAEIDGIALEFAQGRLTRATATRGEDTLQALLGLDDGAAQVGELALGTNPRIDRYIGNTLYDEKIGGTLHIALGAGYPETGSHVRSALHWDLIVDLRQGGRVLADGRAIVVDGRIVAPEWTDGRAVDNPEN
jgi:aminopeptidase